MLRTRFRTRARFIPALGGGGGGYSILNSLRFNDNDSAYLSRTPSVAGDRGLWTWSGWVKRGNLTTGAANQGIFCAVAGSGSATLFYINANDQLLFATEVGGSNRASVYTSAVLRDVSGWYHIVVSLDTAETDKVKIYVNGELQSLVISVSPTSTDSYYYVNSTVKHGVGARTGSSSDLFFDGYMADVNFIDGQALTPSDFGEINEDTGEWSPKKYSGTYGTNGFYLAFEDGSALGDDTSGNTNDWTPTNLASTDQMLDTPTNNFNVISPLTASTLPVFSEGNLLVTAGNSSNIQSSYSSTAVSSGKYYAEFNLTERTNNGLFIAAGTYVYPRSSSNQNGLVTGITCLATDGATRRVTVDGVTVESGFSFSNGDIIGVALNADDGEVQFYKNNALAGTLGPYSITDIGTGEYYFIVFNRDNTNNSKVSCNFGQDSSFAGLKTRQGNTDGNGIGDFYYTPPAGYLALCTDNLPEPTIVDSETQFNVVTYTGDNALSRTITGVGFEPDFVWIKRRNQSASHALFDSVRGATKMLSSDLTDAEATRTDTLTSFDSDGFTVSDSGFVNDTADTYVAWCWKAGGTAVTNTDGSITSQVSANVDAGFSIVSYTAAGSSSATVGHGLSSTPEIVIYKERAATSNWAVMTTAIDGSYDYLKLNLTDAKANDARTPPTSSLLYDLGYANGRAIIAYAFHSVEGFSKIGTYIGNGSADGPFVYTGFRPAFVLYKRATGGTGNWILYDNKREGYNGDNPALYPNLSNAEATSGTSIDLLSNGFKILNPNTDHNASGSTYIYMAFAEAPFKNALAR